MKEKKKGRRSQEPAPLRKRQDRQNLRPKKNSPAHYTSGEISEGRFFPLLPVAQCSFVQYKNKAISELSGFQILYAQ